MQIKRKFLSLALCAFGLGAAFSACSNEEIMDGSDLDHSAANSIKFSASQNSIAASRATAITGGNYLDASLTPSMKVWGYFSPTAVEGAGIVPGAQYVGADNNSITIDNNSTLDPLKSVWEYNNSEDQAYWPKQPLNFYAVIGAHNTDVVKSVASVSSANNLAHIVATVEVPEANASQKDVMFAKSVDQTRSFEAAGIDPVNFSFQHALSQIVFQGKCAAAKISADVKSITICNADSKGRVGYLTDESNDVVLGSELAADAERGYGKFAAGLVADATLNGTNNLETAKNLTAANGALMMLPQTGATKWATVPGTPVTIAYADLAHQTYLKIECKLKNDNVYLIGDASTYGEVYIPFEIDWAQGKKYTYTLIFGAGAGGYDVDGNPLASTLPITYTVSAPTEWENVDPVDVPDAESEAAKLAAVNELRAYAQQVITAGGNTSDINAALEAAIQNVWATTSVAGINAAKQNGMNAIDEFGPIIYTTVDLGLPSGLKWASSNIGARNPEDVGLYFAWGETTGYAFDSGHIFNGSHYTADDVTSDLSLAHDAAHVYMGGLWRMPSKVNYDELISGCNVSWTTNYEGSGVAGTVFTSKTNGNSIFFPAAGYNYNNSAGPSNKGYDGYYWSSTFNDSYYAYYLSFNSSSHYTSAHFRENGYSIRGVQP